MVYLDHAATTPIDPRVRAAMRPWLEEQWGNASSGDHRWGWDAASAVEQAREQVAGLINAQAHEIVFTSGATESLNQAIKGWVGSREAGRLPIIFASRVEHEAVLATCSQLQRRNRAEIFELDVDANAQPRIESMTHALDMLRPGLLVMMLANNEIGTVTSLLGVARRCKEQGVLLLSDLAQAVGKIPVDVAEMGIDLAALSAHKIYGPKGVGALFVRSGEPRIELEPLIVGGGQERGSRAGTANVAGIVGFGEACRIVQDEMANEAVRVRRLRDRLEAGIAIGTADIRVNGAGTDRLPSFSNILFRGANAKSIIREMGDVAVSSRSACAGSSATPSHVLTAIGLGDEEASCCLRFSIGRFTDERDIDLVIARVCQSVARVRGLKHSLHR